MNLVGPTCWSAWTRGSASLPGSWSPCAILESLKLSMNLKVGRAAPRTPLDIPDRRARSDAPYLPFVVQGFNARMKCIGAFHGA